MDGRGRLAEPVTRPARLRRARRRRAAQAAGLPRFMQRLWVASSGIPLPRGTGVAAASILLLGSLTYATVIGGHVDTVRATMADWRHGLASAAGFRITSVALAGGTQVSRDEVLELAGVTGRTSLLFLDATAVRDRLRSNPWIAEATVLKLYPGQLRIDIVERQPFVLWQKDGEVSVVARDGTVIAPFKNRHFEDLPFVVGTGAREQAQAFLVALEKHPSLRKQMLVAIRVADRRWTLRLKNGVDVKLPERDVDAALARLATLDRDKKLLSKDITEVDLRLADRVTVRLSDEAYAARQEQLKTRKSGPGGNA